MRTSIRFVIVAVAAIMLAFGGFPGAAVTAARAQDDLDFDLSG